MTTETNFTHTDRPVYPIHVFYVIDSIGTPGGAEESLALLAPYLVNSGIRLDVGYLHDRPGHQDALRAAGCRLVDLSWRGGRAGWAFRTWRAIRALRPDLVHTTLFEADIAGRVGARVAGVPVVSSVVSTTAPPPTAGGFRSAAKYRAAMVLDRWTARLCTRIHAVSVEVANSAIRDLHYPRERIDVVARGRNPEQLGRRTPARRAAARMALGITDDRPVLLAVARQEHAKGLDVLLHAMPAVLKRFGAAHLFVAGRPGLQTPALEALVDDLALGPRVTFLGNRDDVPDLLCTADCFVLPSRREGMPGAVIEAMALEAPIVASDLPQVREVVDGGSARLAAVESADALAGALIATLEDSGGSERRVAAARARFEAEFTIDRAAQGMVEFYRRALALPRRGLWRNQ